MDEDSTPDKADPSQEDSPADAPAEAAATEEPSVAAAEGGPQAAPKDGPPLKSGLALLDLVYFGPSPLISGSVDTQAARYLFVPLVLSVAPARVGFADSPPAVPQSCSPSACDRPMAEHRAKGPARQSCWISFFASSYLVRHGTAGLWPCSQMQAYMKFNILDLEDLLSHCLCCDMIVCNAACRCS